MFFKGERGIGDSMRHQKGTTTWPWACLRHTDDTQTCTHGLHDMCGVHPVAATARGLARPNSSLPWQGDA